MRFFLFLAISITFWGGISAPAVAGSLEQVTSRAEFESITTGRKLTALGVALYVSPDGKITGRAFGKDVTGQWTWRDGYFCRDMTFGSKVLAPNCQTVLSTEGRIRFVSDKGTGEVANLRIK